jgi:TPR repeat protein
MDLSTLIARAREAGLDERTIDLAEQGHADAQCNLANCYAYGKDGKGMDKDLVEAVAWCRKAAEQGHADADLMASDSRTRPVWVHVLNVEAVAWYRKAAEQGHADAQCNLATCYEYGKGLDKEDLVEAVEWYRKAAEQGHEWAQWNLGNCYAYGQGVDEDPVEAVAWYRKAAEQGLTHAQYSLGGRYTDGRGVEQDPVEAVAWLRKAAEQGHTDAQHDLAFFEFPGVAVKKDLFPWDDVEVCLREQSQSKKIDTSTKCPECGNSVTVILFTSPPWTWEQLCGREGYLTICEGCHAQLSFELTVMN